MDQIIQHTYTTELFLLGNDGIFPNNSSLPIIIYRSILKLPMWGPANALRRIFISNNWKNEWKNNIYDCHHYHSNTHEVLGVYKGETTIILGGENGQIVDLKKGDVIIIPAGVAYKNLKPKSPFKCVGAYPEGREYDMNYGRIGERPQTDENIKKVPLPSQDPVFGYKKGELQKQWFN